MKSKGDCEMPEMFTAMSAEGIDALKRSLSAYAAESGGYEVRLNANDVACLVGALAAAYEHTADGGCDSADLEEEDCGRWAEEFLSCLAQSQGIDWI